MFEIKNHIIIGFLKLHYFTFHSKFMITFIEGKIDANFLFSLDICVSEIKAYTTQSSHLTL